MDKQKILDKMVWSTTFCVEDILNNAPSEYRDIIDTLSPDQLQKFVDENLGSWSKTLGAGIMFGWDRVARDAFMASSKNMISDLAIDFLERKHNVYIDKESLQYNHQGYDVVIGWHKVPKSWLVEALKQNNK